MNVYTITLERISTGERSASLLFRGETEDAARAYAEDVIAQQTPLCVEANQHGSRDLRVVAIACRPA